MISGSHFFQFCDIKDMVSFFQKIAKYRWFYTLKTHFTTFENMAKFIGKKFTIWNSSIWSFIVVIWLLSDHRVIFICNSFASWVLWVIRVGHVFHLDENGTKESLFGATYHLVGYKLPELVKGKAEAR